ncbi:MAG: MoaD/ThiS family protein [Verrucomicrobiota bacterium]
MQIKILYFAQLADLSGKPEEQVELTDPSLEALYQSIQAKYHFPHTFTQLQIAVNHQLSSHQKPLKDGDEIAFLPPMTSG